MFITGTKFGRIVRGIHAFGATAMIILIGLHAIRVYLMAAYKYPRQMNWLTGAGLLLLTLLMAFTGQLLRWDQTGFWSVVIAAEQAGRTPVIGNWLGHFILAGDTVGGATLSRFFAAHVFFIPALIFLFVGFHLYLVLHNGISEPPQAGRPVDPKTYRSWYHALLARDGEPFWPDAAWRDVVFGFLVIATVVALAMIVGPPALGKPPDPTIVEASPRPEWYFLWYYAVLTLIPRWSEDWVIILGPALFGAALIFLPLVAGKGERSPLRRPWSFVIVAFITFHDCVLRSSRACRAVVASNGGAALARAGGGRDERTSRRWGESLSRERLRILSYRFRLWRYPRPRPHLRGRYHDPCADDHTNLQRRNQYAVLQRQSDFGPIVCAAGISQLPPSPARASDTGSTNEKEQNNESDSSQPAETWNDKPLSSLMEHIVEKHHTFCRQELARLGSLFKDVIARHGKDHPELKRMEALFAAMAQGSPDAPDERRADAVPLHRPSGRGRATEAPVSWPPFGTVENPIRMMVLEHDQTGEELKEIGG